MKKVYTIDLSASGIKELQTGLRDYEKWIERKTEELASRLADMGAQKAEINFAAAYYDGDEDHSITVEQRGDNEFAVIASGRTVLFVEFGTGLIGYGHPEPNGYGPGTYPGKGHWNDPNGWIYGGVGSGKNRKPLRSHGNPPNMPMYHAIEELEQELARVVKEVFAD